MFSELNILIASAHAIIVMVGGTGDANPARARGGAFANAGGKGTPVMFGAPKRPSQTTRCQQVRNFLFNTRSSADGSKYDWLTRDESKYDWLTHQVAVRVL